MKRLRQKAILQVIAAADVETQNQLIEELEKVGIESTQATISRDIRDLHLIKELTSRGTHRYAVSDRPDSQSNTLRLRAIFREGVVSFSTAQNIVVIKTLPSLAPAACSAIDSMGIKNVVGSIAGDDTGFIAMHDVAAAEKFCKEIEDILK